MKTPRIAVSTRSLQVPLRKSFEEAAKLGVQAVEIDGRHELQPQEMTDTAARDIRKLLSDYSLKIAAVHFPTRRGYEVQEELDSRIQATKAAMQMAYQLGSSVVVNHLGTIPEDFNTPEAKIFAEVLSDLAAYGNRVGAWLAARTAVQSGQRLAEFLREMNLDGIVAALDPAALVFDRHDPTAACQALGERIQHVYLKDGTRDFASGRNQQVPLGRGLVDFPELFGQLEDMDYRGYLCLEGDFGSSPREGIEQSMQFLTNLLR